MRKLMKTESAMPMSVKGMALIRAKIPGCSCAAKIAMTLTMAIRMRRPVILGRIEPLIVKRMSLMLGCERTIIFFALIQAESRHDGMLVVYPGGRGRC